MSREEIIDFLGDDWTGVQRVMSESLASDINLLHQTNDGILSHSGKMLRPLVSLLCARACAGICTPDSIRYAAASELLHNATLLHDDVADESDTRRGRPTLRSLLGPSSAVLVGDFWLARAVDLVVGTDHSDKVVKLFSKTLTDLAEGEMLQLQKAGTADTSTDDYIRIIYNKTASLFEASCVSGAISVDASEQMKEAVRAYARAMGIAFQIRDDILDYEGGDALGKPVGIDLKERKITLPLLCALKDSEREQQIRSMVASIPEHPEYCDRVREFVFQRKGVEAACEILETYIDKALEALEMLPEGRARDFLAHVGMYNSNRRK